MNLPEIKYCPVTLQADFTTYSPAAQHALFGSLSKNISHILPFGAPGTNSELTRTYNDEVKQICISGVQEKYSLQLVENKLVLTHVNGTFILKPVPAERLDRGE
jgi:serine/threonine-protein kinase HipA